MSAEEIKRQENMEKKSKTLKDALDKAKAEEKRKFDLSVKEFFGIEDLIDSLNPQAAKDFNCGGPCCNPKDLVGTTTSTTTGATDTAGWACPSCGGQVVFNVPHVCPLPYNPPPAFPTQGWSCPKCGRCYAPFIAACPSCNGYSLPGGVIWG